MTGTDAATSMAGLDFSTPLFVTEANNSGTLFYPQLAVFANSEDSTVSGASLESVMAYATVINLAAIGGVTEPVRDAVPVTTIIETEQYTGTINWSPEVIDNKFAAETVYTATITLTAKAGYTLTGVSENFFTVEGADTVSNAANSGVITAVFPATAPIYDECFIATAAFGSKFDWPVSLLRHFRDQYLLTNSLGMALVEFYYHHSPPIAAMIASSEPLKILVRVLLAPVIALVYAIYHPILMVTLLGILYLIYRYKLRRRPIQV